MTTKTTASAQARTNTRSNQKSSSARTALPLTWSATEYVPGKRWWWFIGLTVISLWLLGLALAFQVWSLAALIVATALVFFVMYLAKPRAWKYELTKTELRITRDKKKLSLRLDQFRIFTVEELPRRRGHRPEIVIVMLPIARFWPAVDVYLTQDDEKDLVITQRLGEALAYEDSLQIRGLVRLLDRIARGLRLG